MKKIISIFILATLLFGCRDSSHTNSKNNETTTHLNVRLKWQFQAQFAGYIVAKEKGFYKDAGLDVALSPAGPNIRPYILVAAGTDDIGIGVPNQIIMGHQQSDNSLMIISQIMQESPFAFILKKENAIHSLKDLKDKKVGLWMGGDEAEFAAMLKTAGMTLNDVKVIPQGFTVVPFLNGDYVLSHVTLYNELNLIRSQGYTDDKLQILYPRDYGSAIPGDLIFTNQAMINNNSEALKKFLEASFRGWKYAKDHPDETVDLILKVNPELKKDDQEKQLKSVLELVFNKQTADHGLGYMDIENYKNAERILYESKQLDKRVDVSKIYDPSIWNLVPDSLKKL